MKPFILVLFCLSMQMCSQVKQPVKSNAIKNSSSMENSSSKKENPYYSRTDRTKLNVPNSEWKKILDPEVYAVARELIQKDLEPVNTISLMNWENITALFAEIICSVQILNFLQLAVGQVFSKPIKKAFLAKEIPPTEWNVLKFYVKDVIRI